MLITQNKNKKQKTIEKGTNLQMAIGVWRGEEFFFWSKIGDIGGELG